MTDMRSLQPTNLGEMLKLIRTEKNLNLTQLAQKSGVSISYLSDLEKGRTLPSLETLGKIATALDHRLSVSMDEPGKDVAFPVTTSEIEMLLALRQGNFERFMVMAASILVVQNRSEKAE